MAPNQHFRFCSRCGRERQDPAEPNRFRCGACGFLYFFNPAIAAAGILLGGDGRVLWIRRAKEPAQGKLAMPGGFIDVGETAEAALRREVREEVGLELRAVEYLCSQPNTYVYAEVTYPVLDLFFVAKTDPTTEAAALDGVASFCWLRPAEVDPKDLAFPSMERAWRFFRDQCG